MSQAIQKDYPNPAMDMVYVKSDQASIGTEYFLVDMYGKVLANGRIHHEITSLSIGHFASGMHLFRAGNNYEHSYRITKS